MKPVPIRTSGLQNRNPWPACTGLTGSTAEAVIPCRCFLGSPNCLWKVLNSRGSLDLKGKWPCLSCLSEGNPKVVDENALPCPSIRLRPPQSSFKSQLVARRGKVKLNAPALMTAASVTFGRRLSGDPMAGSMRKRATRCRMRQAVAPAFSLLMVCRSKSVSVLTWFVLSVGCDATTFRWFAKMVSRTDAEIEGDAIRQAPLAIQSDRWCGDQPFGQRTKNAKSLHDVAKRPNVLN